MDSSSWLITEKHKKNKIYFDKKPHTFLLSLFFPRIPKQMPEDPTPPTSTFTHTTPNPLIHPQYDVILKCMRLRPPSSPSPRPLTVSLVYRSFICDVWKPCKTLFALKFRYNFNLVFKVATQQLQKPINVELHSTDDTCDHFIRN